MARMKPKRTIKKVVNKWKQKNGKKIRICDMDDQHLYNTIKMLERAVNVIHLNSILDGYQALAFLQGEQAILSVEQELDRMEEDGAPDPSDVWPIYDKLVLEAELRGLNLEQPARSLASAKKDFSSCPVKTKKR